MDPALKHRLIGAAVLSALAIIFLPKLIVSHDPRSSAADVPLSMPNAPGGEFQTKELPLVTPAAGVPQGGVVGMDASHPAAPAVASSSALPAAGLQPAPNASASGAAAAPITVNLPTTSAPATAAPTTAPATAAPSPPVPAANTGGRYVVSLGTYSNAANAQSLVASLKAAQLPAYAETMSVAGVPATRVRIGPYSQRGDAEAARLKSQQVRTDMPANVIALDAAVSAPDAAAAPNKPVSATAAPAAKPTVPTTAPAVKPTTPSVPTTAAATKPAATSAAAPVPASTKPATPSPAATGRGYVVQLVAFRSQDEALTLRDKLRAAGFTAFSERVQVDSGALYRVRVGPEADRDAADRLRAEVSAKLGLSGIVVAYP
jgi:cell division septation protein DedD